MTGPEHYAEAERLLAVADRHTSGVTYGPEWTLTVTAAHVHATLALAAATAVGTAGPDRTAWSDIAATRTMRPQRASAGTHHTGHDRLSPTRRTSRHLEDRRPAPSTMPKPSAC